MKTNLPATGLDRREFLARTAVGAAGLALGGSLAGCGTTRYSSGQPARKMPSPNTPQLKIAFSLADIAAQPEVICESATTLKQLSRARKLLAQSKHLMALDVIEGLLAKGKQDLAVAMLLSREFGFATGDSLSRPNCREAVRQLALTRKPFDAALKFEGQRRKALTIREKDPSGAQFREAVHVMEGSHEIRELGWIGQRVLSTLQNALPEHDAGHGWDWTDSVWYTQAGLPIPFNQNTCSGRYTISAECRPESGWILFTRRILKNDGVKRSTASPTELGPFPQYFALYNTRTAVLRTFIRYQKEASSYDQIIIKAWGSTGGETNVLNSHGLFNMIGARSYTAPENAAMRANFVVGIATPKSDAWFISDYPLAYDTMGYSDEPEFLNVYLYAHSTQRIFLEGAITSSSSGIEISSSSYAEG